MTADSRDFRAALYRTLYTIRVFETRSTKLYREGLIRGYFHPYIAEETTAAGVCRPLFRQIFDGRLRKQAVARFESDREKAPG